MRRERAHPGALHLHMDVLGAPRVFARDNRFKNVASIWSGGLISTKPIARIVVGAAGIRLPEVEACPGNRAAIAAQHAARQCQAGAGHARLDK